MGVAVQEAFGASSQWFEENYGSVAEMHKALADSEKAVGDSVPPRDWVYRTWALESHNIGDTRNFSGDYVAAARSIKARFLAFMNCHDQMRVSRESGNFEAVQAIPTAKIININDIRGHSGTGTPVSQALITDEIRALLDRVEKSKSGIRGSRFPRGWNSPQDMCSVN